MDRLSVGGSGGWRREASLLALPAMKAIRVHAFGGNEAMVLDEEFLRAMEYAMPPTTGTGMGIDRLLMVLTGLSIRETVLFPIVRRQAD